MQLQQFLTEVVEGLGGVVIPLEYGLCQVLIPEAYTHYFQNKSEFELSFDFEVAQENPKSEFITFGSYVLEQLLAIAQQKATGTLRFAEIERLQIGHPIKKLKEFMVNDLGKIEIIEERPVLGVWAVFQYNVAYVADERNETSEQVWVNLITNEISSAMKREQNRINYQQEPLYTYPIPCQVDTLIAFNKATKHVKEIAEKQKKEQAQTNNLAKDLDRITNYYQELLAENEKRATRKGLSEEKKKDIAIKSEAIELEKSKQLQEINHKYNGEVEINIDNGILYFIPLLEFNVEVQFRSQCKIKNFYYNPVTKLFFERTFGDSPPPL